MTAREKTGLKILSGAAVVALTWYFVYQPGNASSGGTVSSSVVNPAKDLKATQEAQIRFDLLEPASAEEAGRKNLFQYRQKSLPPQPPPERPPFGIVPSAVPDSGTTLIPRDPPAPAFRAFRYEGFSLRPTTGKFLASLSEGGNTYEVGEGDCLLGQYCVRRITENLVEIEDVLQKRRQTLTRVQ